MVQVASKPPLIFGNRGEARFSEIWLNSSMPHRTEPNDGASSLIHNPLVASVLRENVRIADGRAMIGLWDGWPFLLSELPAFGPVLRITRNCYAVLGTIGEYPEVISVPCGHRGRAADGSLEFDFTSWARGTAVVESRREGWLYAIEFSDLSGEVIHKLCLTDQSDFEAFRSWVELNQSSSRSRDFGGVRVASWLENSCLFSAAGAEVLRVEALSTFFQVATAERSGFQIIVGNEGAVQGVTMTPTMFRCDGQWIFFGDKSAGVHLRVAKLAEIYLQTIDESLTLKAYDPEGRFVCAVIAANQAELHPWNEHLRELARTFSTDQT
jgi:putative heme degradation protein